MLRVENLEKFMKICIFAFLCNEMQTNIAYSNAAEQSFNHSPSIAADSVASVEHAYHQASIRLANDDHIFGEGHICGGALIAPSMVLTVAQCVHNYRTQTTRHPADLKIVMGTLNRYQCNPNTLVYGVTHIHRPKTFNVQTLRDNIAVIMLERDIPGMHPTVRPITLSLTTIRDVNEHEVKLSEATKKQQESASYEVTSWLGGIEEHLPHSHSLISLNATRLNDQLCVEKYGRSYGPDMLCIGYEGATPAAAYEQDAGSPLVRNGVLLALTATQSGADDCNIKNSTNNSCPATFVDVGYHAQWILEQIGDGTNRNSSVWGTLGFLLFTILTAKRTKMFRFWI